MADNVANRGWILYAVSWPLFGLSVIVTTLRFYVRIRILRSLGWDDAFILLALMCAIVNTVLVTLSVQSGTGRHMEDLSHSQQIASAKYQLLSQGFHVMATNWGKVSVALFLVRIISEVKQHKRAMYAGIVIMTVVNVVGVYTVYGQCTPVAKTWDYIGVEGRCWPDGAQRDYAYFQGSFSALSDFLLAIYPLFTIKNLQMATKVKVGLGFVLSLGIIAMIAAIVKTIHLAALAAHENATWDMVDLTVWVAVEQYFIILAACIPALTPLFNIIVRHRSSKRSRSAQNELQATLHSKKAGSRHQQYLPFASVGRNYVEYPMTWTKSGRDTKRESGESFYKLGTVTGSESEMPINGEEPELPHGILRTTEFRIKEVSRYEGG
ncbi:hypothetical protein BJY04DRAFT_227572 [Aspergillus karnatakaensis]|uniref:uncharacterized protein n=1 Tax=Aspergillus karnatakaensis TaxID=1810916 RepID=UPI003CCE2EBE